MEACLLVGVVAHPHVEVGEDVEQEDVLLLEVGLREVVDGLHLEGARRVAAAEEHRLAAAVGRLLVLRVLALAAERRPEAVVLLTLFHLDERAPALHRAGDLARHFDLALGGELALPEDDAARREQHEAVARVELLRLLVHLRMKGEGAVRTKVRIRVRARAKVRVGVRAIGPGAMWGGEGGGGGEGRGRGCLRRLGAILVGALDMEERDAVGVVVVALGAGEARGLAALVHDHVPLEEAHEVRRLLALHHAHMRRGAAERVVLGLGEERGRALFVLRRLGAKPEVEDVRLLVALEVRVLHDVRVAREEMAVHVQGDHDIGKVLNAPDHNLA